MKFFLFPFLLISIISGYSQTKHYKAISINALPLIDPYTSIVQPSFEFSINRSFSVGLSLEIGKFYSSSINDNQVADMSGWGFMPQLRYYPFTKNKPAPFGFFIGTHLRYRILEENYYLDNVDISTDARTFDAGGCLGYKILLGPLNFEFLFGGGFGGGSFNTPNQRDLIRPDFKDDLNSPDDFLRMEINLGFHFPKFTREPKP